MTIRISAPDTAKASDVIELKALIQHPMETGYRRDTKGQTIPRDIIKTFKCTYAGDTIFEGHFGPGIAANPFLTFYARATKSGTLEFRWTGRDGETWSEAHELTVE